MEVTVARKIATRDRLLEADKETLDRKLRREKLTLRSTLLWMRTRKLLERSGRLYEWYLNGELTYTNFLAPFCGIYLIRDLGVY